MKKVAWLKKKNKRIFILVEEHCRGGVIISILTKTLRGSWRDRDIMESHVSYGLETFLAIYETSRLLFEDPEFKKAINPELGKLERDKMIIRTNIKMK